LRHLFVTNDFPPKLGGIESYLTNLCAGFDPADVAVVAPAREGHEDVDAALPYDVIRLDGTYLRGSKEVRVAITDAVRDLDVDAVHFLAALPLGRLGPRVRKDTGVPFTVVAHGTGEILLPARVPGVRQVLRRVLVGADVVFANSEFTRSAVDRITKGRASTALLPPTVDPVRFSLEVSGATVRSEYGLGSRFVVLFLSRLVKRKGADVVIRALAATEGTVGIIAGDGPERASLERLAREVGVTDRLIFTGLVADERLAEYYAASDVFCMPCTDRYGGLDTEGFGVVYIEAQATGLPVIAGRCGGSVEAVSDGVAGYVIDEPDPSEVAARITELRNDPGLCAKLGGAGRARVEAEFVPEVAASRLEDAIAALSG
jgi:phosphatidyl-myo-inositol dimannoside synthase